MTRPFTGSALAASSDMAHRVHCPSPVGGR